VCGTEEDNVTTKITELAPDAQEARREYDRARKRVQRAKKKNEASTAACALKYLPARVDSATPGPLPVARTDFEDGEPRVRDVDFAAFLGFERPRVIRELIERHSEALGPRRTVRRGDNEGNRAHEEQWLTEHQCIYLAAKSETPIANEILQQVIDVFLAARRGELPLAPAPAKDPILLLLEVNANARKDFLVLQAQTEAIADKVSSQAGSIEVLQEQVKAVEEIADSFESLKEQVKEVEEKATQQALVALSEEEHILGFEYLRQRGFSILEAKQLSPSFGTAAAGLAHSLRITLRKAPPSLYSQQRHGSSFRYEYPRYVLDRVFATMFPGRIS
jgi:hypothetical protein